MNISKSHKRYSERLNNPRVLSNPEEFLGPNYEAVLNFWLILDGLSEDECNVFIERYWDFFDNNYSEWLKAANVVYHASNETIGSKFASSACYSAYGACKFSYRLSELVYYITYELIGMDLLLDQQKPLTFLPMFLEVL